MMDRWQMDNDGQMVDGWMNTVDGRIDGLTLDGWILDKLDEQMGYWIKS